MPTSSAELILATWPDRFRLATRRGEGRSIAIAQLPFLAIFLPQVHDKVFGWRGLTGALVNAGLGNDDAERYQSEIDKGNALIVVHTSNEEEADTARRVLQGAGAMLKAA